jgi:hypothetical protein
LDVIQVEWLGVSFHSAFIPAFPVNTISTLLAILYVIYVIVRGIQEAAKRNQPMPIPEDELVLEIEPSPKKPKSQKRPPKIVESSEKESERPHRRILSRELAPQGEGTRFEADPGTFDSTAIVSPSIEPTVKPTLESMTGIYEASPTSSEMQDQPLTLDIQRLIVRPEGIRQAIILAEILKQPEWSINAKG